MKVEDMIQDALAKSWNFFKKQYVVLIVGGLIATIGSIFIITAPPLYFGLFFIAWNIVDGKKVEISDVFKGFNYFIVSWIMLILYLIAIILGLIFFVLPGLVLMILFQYAVAVAIAEKKGAVDSLKRSYRLAMDNFVFSLIFALIMWIINGIGGALQIGWVITCPFSVLATCVAYKKLALKK